jgi:hypothetical protein
MILEAVFREFPAKILRKLTVSSSNRPENARNPVQGSGDRIELPVLTGSCWFRAEPDKSGHRIRSLEYCFHEIRGSYGFLGGLFDLGCKPPQTVTDTLGTRRTLPPPLSQTP